MKASRFLARKFIKHNKKKTISVLIGIIISTSLLFGIAFLFSTMNRNTLNKVIYHIGDHHVIFNNVSLDNYQELKNNPNIKSIPVDQIYDTVNLPNCNFSLCKLRLIKSDLSYEDNIVLLNGVHPKDDNEIIISKEMALNSSYQINDKINDYLITGIYQSSSLKHEYDVSHLDIIYEGYLNNEYKDSINVNLTINYHSLNNIYKKIEEDGKSLGFNKTIDNWGNSVYENTKINYNYLHANYKYEKFSPELLIMFLWLLFLLLITSLFCSFVIYNAFNISLSERKKYLGTLRSIGSSKRLITKSVIYEAKILALLSIPVGIIISFLVGNSLIYVLNRMLNESFKLTLYPHFAFMSLLFITLTVYLSARNAAFSASRISPVNVIRQHDDIYLKKTKIPKMISLFNVPGEIAYKTIKRNKNKYRSTLISLCISFVLFMTFSIYTSYLVHNWLIDFNNDYDIQIMINESDEAEEMLSDIINIKEIDEQIHYQAFSISYEMLDRTFYTEDYLNLDFLNETPYLSLYGVDNEIYHNYLKELKVKDKNYLIYNYETLDKKKTKVFEKDNFSLKLNDVKFDSLSNSLKPIQGKYLTTLDDIYLTDKPLFKGQTFSIVTNLDTYNNIINLYTSKVERDELWLYTRVLINSKNYRKFDLEMNKIIDKYLTNDLMYENFTLNNQDEYKGIRAIKLVLYTIVGIITTAGVFSIINSLNTNMKLREKEFAMIRSVGLSNDSLKQMIKFESIFLGFNTLLYAIPITILIFIFWIFLYYLITKEIIVMFPFKSFILGIISLLSLIMMIMSYNLNKIKKLNLVKAIKDDNI